MRAPLPRPHWTSSANTLLSLQIIRERNPRPKKRRKQVQPPTDAAAQPASFIDLVFGGTLASILVCSECHHVSVTREPFNDLSLSLHADASRDRKARDLFVAVQSARILTHTAARQILLIRQQGPEHTGVPQAQCAQTSSLAAPATQVVAFGSTSIYSDAWFAWWCRT